MIQKTKRNQTIIRTSVISILTNLCLVVMKAAVGFMANSIAIITDAVNNLSDALSSIITIIGTKIAGKSADRNHPYGHGRIEYVASFVVSAIVLYAGVTALVESIQKIINPSEPDYDCTTIIILVIGVIGKIALGFYVKRTGKRLNSGALTASGADALNDAILSVSVLLSALLFMIWKIDIEAYIGIFVSAYIIKSGIELIRESINSIVGIRADAKLTSKIKKEILKNPDITGAYDLILTDYGPEQYMGSVHIEVPSTMSVVEVDKISRSITKNIYDKYGVVLHTIGVYSINTQDKNVVKIKNEVEKIVFSHSNILQMHGFYVDKDNMILSFDLIVDFAEKNRSELYQKIYDTISKKYPEYKISITLDIDISD